MKGSSDQRIALRRAKLVRSLQLLKQASNQGRIKRELYQKLYGEHFKKLQQLDELGKEPMAGGVYSHLEIPAEIEKKAPEKEPEHPLLGGFFLKVALAILVFFMIGYLVQFVVQQDLICVVVALACPLLYLYIAYQADWYEPEPIHFVLGAFVWGMMAGVLALWLNHLALNAFQNFWSYETALVTLICLAGVTEELTKGLGLFKLSRHPEYNDPTDGVVYGMAVGLGFAAYENLLYFAGFFNLRQIGLLSEYEFTMTLALRSTLSALGHASFTGMLSLLLAQAKLRNGMPSIFNFIFAYFVAALLHGIFNGVITKMPAISMFVVIVLIVSCLLYFASIVRTNWNRRTWNYYAVGAAKK